MGTTARSSPSGPQARGAPSAASHWIEIGSPRRVVSTRPAASISPAVKASSSSSSPTAKIFLLGLVARIRALSSRDTLPARGAVDAHEERLGGVLVEVHGQRSWKDALPVAGSGDHGRNRTQPLSGERAVERSSGRGRPVGARRAVAQHERVAPERSGVLELEDVFPHAPVIHGGYGGQGATGNDEGELRDGVVDDLESVEQADRIGPRDRADRQTEDAGILVGRIAVLIWSDEARLRDGRELSRPFHLDDGIAVHDGDPRPGAVLVREAAGSPRSGRDQKKR